MSVFVLAMPQRIHFTGIIPRNCPAELSPALSPKHIVVGRPAKEVLQSLCHTTQVRGGADTVSVANAT